MIFSTPVFAQSNGSKPVEQIKYAENLISFANTHAVCSSTYISNSTYRAECSSDVSELTSLVNAWESELDAGTLTVAYDTSIQEFVQIIQSRRALLLFVSNESSAESEEVLSTTLKRRQSLTAW